MKENVYSLERSGAYLRRRAGENRRAGRYGEAMTLLRMAGARAYPPDPALLWEQSEILNDVGLHQASSQLLCEILQTCPEEEQGACFYALGENAYAMGDARRAQDYLSLFLDGTCADEAYNHALTLLESAQTAAGDLPVRRKDPQAYARRLTQRALLRMRQGKMQSAKRLLLRAHRIRREAEVYTLLSVCAMAQEDYKAAAHYCARALACDAHNVRMRCTQAYIAAARGEKTRAQRALLRAMQSAKTEQECMSVAQCASDLGLHEITRLFCGRVLKDRPYHPLAAHLYAIACMNTGRVRSASRVWGRMARMLGEDTVIAYYDRLATQCLSEGKRLEPLQYSVQVPPQEAQERLMKISACLSELDEQALPERFESDAQLRALLRWLLYLPSRNASPARAAMSVLARVGTESARRMLLVLLLGDAHSDEQKHEALSLLSYMGQERPCFAYLEGTLVRAVPQTGEHAAVPRGYERVIQDAVNRMGVTEEAQARSLMKIWRRFAQTCDEEAIRRHADIWPLALEWAYGRLNGNGLGAKSIARREGVSARLIVRLGRPIIKAQKAQKESDKT